MPVKGSKPSVREMFLHFFGQKGHRSVHSSSLVPANDPTLLFTNAGMNQFKDVFLGLEHRDYKRAASSQKCVRAGGKHNDLENVGFTNRHHTFFEMLGNFSFGDYFKRDAIAFAWELITSKEWYGLDKQMLYVTIFEGAADVPRDADAERFWEEQGVAKDRIFAMGMKDNFWQMGDTGPCGPCSEIHYDMGVAASDKKDPKCAAGECKFPCDCGRYVEIWNLVFMQFNRQAEGGAAGQVEYSLEPLPAPSVDTGMGLERITAVMQGVVSNYETDLFVPLMKRAAELCGVDYEKETSIENTSRSAASLRVIADHARATTFLINDGVVPANEGRGYVLRKIMRRAIRHGRLLGQNKPFLSEMVFAVRDLMQDAYPELRESVDRVAKVVLAEEGRFGKSLGIAFNALQDLKHQNSAGESNALLGRVRHTHPKAYKAEGFPESLQGTFDPNVYDEIRKEWERAAKPGITGEQAFRLYDTFGLPLDFMVDDAHDEGNEFDMAGFDRAMAEQRERARASWKGGSKASASPVYRGLDRTHFEGYTQLASEDCEVIAIVKDGVGVQELKAGGKGEIVLDHTSFYADSGGQVGDEGWFYASSGNRNTLVAEVYGCVLPVQGVRAHKVTAKQNITVGDKVEAVVNGDLRVETTRNHTGTHLVHAALREILGTHVKQAGSLVDPKHLRFDFSHFTSVSDEEMQDIEDLTNREVLKNTQVVVHEDVPIDVAVNEMGAMALFGEKYGERVRVIQIGDFSTELCGGIHTRATGEIGLLKIMGENSVSSGVRRIEAVTGRGSLEEFRRDHSLEQVLNSITGSAKTSPESVRSEFEKRDDEIKRLRKELEQMRMKSAASAVSSATDQAVDVDGLKVLAQRVDNVDRNQMRVLVDNLRNKLGTGVVVLGSVADGKVALIVGVTKDSTGKIQAGKVIGEIAKKVGGKGGGRPDLAEAGGNDPSQLDTALSSAPDVVRALLG